MNRRAVAVGSVYLTTGGVNVARSAIWALRPDIGVVRLEAGSHSSPREGICAVELASLLGAEEFSDRPDCVCEVIAAFMRSWNDRVAHADRQALILYAELAVGSRAGANVTRLRRDICLVWAGARLDGGPLRSLLERLVMRVKIFRAVGLRQALRLNEGAGEYGARVVFSRFETEEGFAVLDRLLEVGEEEAVGLEAAPLAKAVEGAAQARIAAAVRELAGDAQVAHRENGHQRSHHNGHPGHLDGRDPRQRHEEEVEDDRAAHRDPEGETNPAQDLHRTPA